MTHAEPLTFQSKLFDLPSPLSVQHIVAFNCDCFVFGKQQFNRGGLADAFLYTHVVRCLTPEPMDMSVYRRVDLDMPPAACMYYGL